MTSSDSKKVLKQISHKPGKMAKFNKYNTPKDRKFGKRAKRCKITGNTRGVIHRYGIEMDRKTFRKNAQKLGFKKYS